MLKKLSTITVVVVVLGALATLNRYQPSRLTAERIEESRKAQQRLETVEAAVEDIELEASNGAAEEEATEAAPKTPAETAEKSAEEQPAEEAQEKDGEAMPDVFKVKFECSNGDFVMECHQDWAPLGVARFYDLVKEGVYDGARFFRVVPGFVVQFGIPGDPDVAAKWRSNTIKDDPVRESNMPGTVSFAMAGPNSRTSQIFINLGNNRNLDGMGFAPIGKVVKGMDVVKAINPEYGQRPDQGLIQTRGNAYLEEQFPNMDYVKSARIVE